jgi:hypothetical protein
MGCIYFFVAPTILKYPVPCCKMTVGVGKFVYFLRKQEPLHWACVYIVQCKNGSSPVSIISFLFPISFSVCFLPFPFSLPSSFSCLLLLSPFLVPRSCLLLAFYLSFLPFSFSLVLIFSLLPLLLALFSLLPSSSSRL